MLERRRRSAASDVQQQSDVRSSQSDFGEDQPVVFWCSAENLLGETSVWWPGPEQEPDLIGVWSSILIGLSQFAVPIVSKVCVCVCVCPWLECRQTYDL